MNVFLISTPSQAFFLLKSPDFINYNSILIILKNNSNNHKRILFYLNRFQWKDILIWDTESIDQYKNYYKIFKFSRLIKKFRFIYGSPAQIFIGSYDNLFQLSFVAKFEKKSKIFLLYDGLQMVSVSNSRKLNVDKGIRSFSWIFKLARLNKPEISRLTFVSPLDLKISANDNIIKLRKDSITHPKLDMNLVYIVGQPLVDIGIISIENFKYILQEIKRDYCGYIIEYIPHPAESTYVKSVIKEYFNILELNIIFEEHYISCNDLFAGTIISFFSSVLINMCYLSYPSKIVAYKIQKENIINESSALDIELMYSYFKQIKNPKFQLV